MQSQEHQQEDLRLIQVHWDGCRGFCHLHAPHHLIVHPQIQEYLLPQMWRCQAWPPSSNSVFARLLETSQKMPRENSVSPSGTSFQALSTNTWCNLDDSTRDLRAHDSVSLELGNCQDRTRTIVVGGGSIPHGYSEGRIHRTMSIHARSESR